LGALFAAHGWMTPYFYSSGLRHKDLDKQVELARVIIPEAREKITKILPEVIQLTQLMPAGSPEFMSQLARILGPILETNPAAVVELSDAILTGKIFEGRGDGIIWEISDLVFASAGGQPLAEKIIHSFLLRSARSEVRTAEDAVPLGEFSKWDELEQEVMRLFEQRMFAEIALGSAEDMAAGTWKERVDLTHEPVMQQRQPADYLRETLQIIRQQYLVSEMDVPGLKHAGWRFRLALEDAGYHFKLFTVKPPEEKNTILAIVYSKTEESARSEVRAEGAVKPSESLDEITAQLASFRQSRASYEQTISGNGSDTERTAARMNMSRIGKRIASLEAKLAELQKQRAGDEDACVDEHAAAGLHRVAEPPSRRVIHDHEQQRDAARDVEERDARRHHSSGVSGIDRTSNTRPFSGRRAHASYVRMRAAAMSALNARSSAAAMPRS